MITLKEIKIIQVLLNNCRYNHFGNRFNIYVHVRALYKGNRKKLKYRVLISESKYVHPNEIEDKNSN